MSGQLNTVSRTCEFCFHSKQETHQLRCKHVLCGSCDDDFTKQFPEHEGRICHYQKDSGDEETPYLKPIPATRLLRHRKMSSSTLELRCESCKSHCQTTAHCVNCRMDICQNCVEQHSKMAVLQNHKIESHKRNIQNSPTAEPTIYCREHIEEVANGFCRTCLGTRVCDLCIQASHTGHHIELTQPLSSTIPKPPMTFDELLRETTKLHDHVLQKRAILVSLIEQADKEIQENASNCVQEMLTQAEQMRRDIDQHVLDQTKLIQANQHKLLTRCSRRKNYIVQRTETIAYELKKAHTEAAEYLRQFNRNTSDPGGYTRMNQNLDLVKKRDGLNETIQIHRERLQELTFEYKPSDNGPLRGLGKIDPIRRLSKISAVSLQRFQTEVEYTVTAMTSACDQNVMFTSCKGATKAAIDLVNLNGNPVHMRKLQDNGQNPEITPAFASALDDGIAAVCWESSVFRMKIAQRTDDVLNFGVRKHLVPGAKISCATINRKKKRIAFGNDKNRIIYLLTYEMEYASSITLKEDGRPPTSIAFHGDCLVVSDGEEMAVLVDASGNIISRFIPPRYGFKPIGVACCKGIAYVLWSKQEGGKQMSCFIQCYSLFTKTVGTALGQPLIVDDRSKFITIVEMHRDDDRLITSTDSGHMTIYCIQEM
ncbi:uncharacterized protein [Apostichopus japonicus]|uniref:uncharacterized protein isoform X2 n=1 Tax=Stichopus japonicus TaxID=307972 RepID=UPI003AB436A4